MRETDRRFLKDSQCTNGFGRPPFVCCTPDTGYRRTGGSFFFSQNPEPNPTRFSFPGQSFGGFQGQQPVNRRNLGRSIDLPRPPSCGGISIENKIYGGEDSDLNEFPWMVLLEYKKKNGGLGLNCAGSLINQRYVLTAAHCVTGSIESQVGKLISVRLGEHDISSKVDCENGVCAQQAIRVGVEEVIPHHSYDDRAQDRHNDIALIRMDRDVLYTKSIRPVCLPSVVSGASVSPQPGTTLTVAGWGRTLRTPKSLKKQKLNVPLFSQSECRRKFAARNVDITEFQVCAGGNYAEDSCDGDSGGPLMRFQENAWVIEGIVSFGVKCGLQGWPAVHTRVSSYDNWIRSTIR
ncbi:CLIPB9.2 family protein [Megaselia abdita]